MLQYLQLSVHKHLQIIIGLAWYVMLFTDT